MFADNELMRNEDKENSNLYRNTQWKISATIKRKK